MSVSKICLKKKIRAAEATGQQGKSFTIKNKVWLHAG